MNNILVALDDSERAPAILAVAADLATRTGAKLFLYRAVGIPQELPAIVLSLSPTEVGPLLERLAREGLGKLAATLPPALLGGVGTSIAIPWQGVCGEADRVNADLIVVGSHGYGGLDRLLGTTAAKIVNHAKHSVLVARPKAA